MSSAATGEYYNLINQKVKTVKGGHNIAEMIICSVNFANIERCVRNEDWDAAGEYLALKAKNIESAGAICLFLATNTLHIVRQQIKDAISIPFIDIFDIVSQKIKANGITRVGLLGTYPVMTDPFYVNAYRDCGIELVRPNEKEKRELDRIIFDEMTHHKFLPASKEYYLNVSERLTQNGAEGIILGCTEIKLLINQQDVKDIPLFDTTELHCDMAAQICMGFKTPG